MKVNSLQLLTVYVLQFVINDKTLIYCPVLIIGNVEVGLDIGLKFHQEVMEIVSYDKYKIVCLHQYFELAEHRTSDRSVRVRLC